MWKTIKAHPNYQVSRDGRIRNKKTGKVRKLTVGNRGYYVVCIRPIGMGRKKVHLVVHRFVAATFVANPHGKPQVNHIDGNRLNNHYTNLEWVTGSENMVHAWGNNLQGEWGLRGRKERHKKIKASRDRKVKPPKIHYYED